MLGWDIASINTLSYRDWARQSLTAFASGPTPCPAWPVCSGDHRGGDGARSQAQAGLVELEQAEMNSDQLIPPGHGWNASDHLFPRCILSTHCSSLPWATTGQFGHPGLQSPLPQKLPRCSGLQDPAAHGGDLGAQGSGSHYPGNRVIQSCSKWNGSCCSTCGWQPFPTSIYSSISQGLSIQEPSE